MVMVHKVTLSAMRIELTQSLFRQCALSLQGCYLSPGKHQAYKTYYLYCESTPSLQSLL